MKIKILEQYEYGDDLEGQFEDFKNANPKIKILDIEFKVFSDRDAAVAKFIFIKYEEETNNGK